MNVNKANFELVKFAFHYCKDHVYITSRSIAFMYKSTLFNLIDSRKYESLVRKIGRYLGFFLELGFLEKMSKGRALYKKTLTFPTTFKEFLQAKLDHCYYRSRIFQKGDFEKMCKILDNMNSDFYYEVLGKDAKALEIFYNMRFL